jgi:ABC-2 type transport system permease protein
MLAAQALLELRLTLRRGESILLTLIIPVGLLAFFTSVDVVAVEGERVDFLVPGVLALAVMSSAFTGLAIATGYERAYGVLKRLGASALPRSVLLAGKALAVLAVEALQVLVIVAVGFALGWNPRGPAVPAVAAVALLVVLGTAAFAGLGLLLAGTLRAEATLAAANGLWVVFLLLGGVIFPLSRLPSGLQSLGRALPTAALSHALRDVLAAGAGLPAGDVAVLVAWAAGGLSLAALTFRWE